MLMEITRNWWAVALHGVVAVLFGIAAFVWPQITLTALVILFGAYALVGGGFTLAYAFSTGTNLRALAALEGLVGIAVGIATLVWPNITAAVLLYLIAAWAIVTGLLEIVAAIDLRKVIEDEWMLVLAGIASVAFGIIVAVQPGAGALAVVWMIGFYAVVYGALMIGFGFRLRSLGKELQAVSEEAPRRMERPAA
jgi:uncharacterized membrane protein HdeD (DUF308 family)